ncbi:MAG: hypothetical protein KGI57_08895 [Hyphomicrobiales bacterium]|nr:hypothetical protein [Hyphomicrobiales bacterium]
MGSGAGGGGPGLAPSEAMVAASRRVEGAIRALGRAQASLALDVCVHLKGLETVERERGWPPRAARVALVMALEGLAEHYGIAEEARGPSRGAIRTWAAE